MIVPFTKTIETFADLHRRLGEVPLDRIRMDPYPGSATEDDLLRAPKPTCELIDGVLVEKPMGSRESLLGVYVARLIGNHVESSDLGVVLGEAGHIRVAPGQIRAPDATFIPWSAFPGSEIPEDEAFWAVAPGLVVEVLSPTNTDAEMDRKLRELFAAGCKLAWLIDPRSRSARVFTSPTKTKELGPDGVLDGGRVLPGFKLALADLFAATKRRKKKPR
ncbi:MAG TPA: Uma2 family endonuclease [Fimbriiglobus sp.]|nr:Uma2 family endonuclease [Fimbriiglobus sp.]